MALWSGRFGDEVNKEAAAFGASLPFDKKLFRYDIEGSLAHARMLADQGIISSADKDAIVSGLEKIQESLESGSFTFDPSDEDIHMAIERALIESVGDAGARLHTGRSRNDQVATDFRLYCKESAESLMDAINHLRYGLINKSETHQDVLLCGYTHLQHAQPVSLAHHLLAYFWMLTRDFKRFADARDAADASPLGAAALAGTTYPINRQETAELLHFSSVIPNSLDAVSDRDFALDLIYGCSVCALHLSRLAEEIILWSSQEFGYITLADSYSTGSSIMPQKKNPDFAELIRGKSGRVVGTLMSLMMTLKGLPLAYNKDLQEDKEPTFDAVTTVLESLETMAGMIETMTVNETAMEAQTAQGYLAATDLADYLARAGLPFREAHRVVGKLVARCEQEHRTLESLSLAELQEASPLFKEDVLGSLSLRALVNARQSEGGTAPTSVATQLTLARKTLEQDAEIT